MSHVNAAAAPTQRVFDALRTHMRAPARRVIDALRNADVEPGGVAHSQSNADAPTQRVFDVLRSHMRAPALRVIDALRNEPGGMAHSR